ncbi:MAG: RNA polymerase sigma factor [Bryobacteraceae bacterium]
MSYLPEDLPLGVPFENGARADSHRAPSALEHEVAELFDRFRVNLLRYLCCLGLSMDDSEEIVQEVFLSLFRHLRREKSRDNLRGWLFCVAHNLGLKRRTAVQARSRFFTGTELFADCCASSDASSEEEVSFLQRRQRLLAVVDALPPQDRHCLYLRSEGLQYREIAEILSIFLGSVATSLSRALERLADSERTSEHISKRRWNHASET